MYTPVKETSDEPREEEAKPRNEVWPQEDARVQFQHGTRSVHVPSQRETIEKLAPVLLERGRRFRKVRRAFLRPAVEDEKIETVLDGKVETFNVAKEGDWIVRADTSLKERYILPSGKVTVAYDLNSGTEIVGVEDADELNRGGFRAYLPRTRIIAIEVTEYELAAHFPGG